MRQCLSNLRVRWRIPPGCLIWLCVLVWPSLASAQSRPIPTLESAPGLAQLTLRSGYIFTGTVRAIERTPSAPNQVATVQVTFQVGQAIRGVRTGQTLVIHEWAGLWESAPRYRLGESILLFLYPPSRLGLTSTVGGPLGGFHLDRNGQVVLRQTQIDALWPGSTSVVLRPGGTLVSTKAFTHAIQLAVGNR